MRREEVTTGSPGWLSRVKKVFLDQLVPVSRSAVRLFPAGRLRDFIWDRFAMRDYHFRRQVVWGGVFEGTTQDLIQRYIYYFGVWEPNLTHFVSRRLHHGDVVVDVGANIGYFTVLSSQLVGTSGRVVAVEPVPPIRARLKRHLQLNRSTNVRIIDAAATGSRCELPIYMAARWNIGRSSVRQDMLGAEPQGQWMVPGLPLHEIISDEELPRIRLIKIDVEGSEWEVMMGLEPVINRLSVNCEIIVEVTPSVLDTRGSSGRQVWDLFATRGFHPYRIENSYSHSYYLKYRVPVPPIRLTDEPTVQCDVVFSRIDALKL